MPLMPGAAAWRRRCKAAVPRAACCCSPSWPRPVRLLALCWIQLPLPRNPVRPLAAVSLQVLGPIAGEATRAPCACRPLRRVPHAAADELDEMELEVKADSSAHADGEGATAAAPSEAQRQAARAAVSSMLPVLQGVMEQLLECIRQR